MVFLGFCVASFFFVKQRENRDVALIVNAFFQSDIEPRFLETKKNLCLYINNTS